MLEMRLSLVFTGHMVDLPDRSTPRFPPELVEAARREIRHKIALVAQGFNKSEVAGFASLARGGDILFHETCRALGFETTVVIPFSPVGFLRTSVDGAEGGDWATRFQKLWDETPRSRRHDLGLSELDEGAYAACNQRLLQLAKEAGEVQLIALWDKKVGDGPGGAEDFANQIKQSSGRDPLVVDPGDLRR